MEHMGFDQKSIKWFNSFLTGRAQIVKIGNAVSNKRNLRSGVPQGGILSPFIFIAYGADFKKWLKHSSAYTYADELFILYHPCVGVNDYHSLHICKIKI